jgi:hypothetical protein
MRTGFHCSVGDSESLWQRIATPVGCNSHSMALVKSTRLSARHGAFDTQRAHRSAADSGRHRQAPAVSQVGVAARTVRIVDGEWSDANR